MSEHEHRRIYTQAEEITSTHFYGMYDSEVVCSRARGGDQGASATCGSRMVAGTGPAIGRQGAGALRRRPR